MKCTENWSGRTEEQLNKDIEENKNKAFYILLSNPKKAGIKAFYSVVEEDGILKCYDCNHQYFCTYDEMKARKQAIIDEWERTNQKIEIINSSD